MQRNYFKVILMIDFLNVTKKMRTRIYKQNVFKIKKFYTTK